jgi:MFS family permease
MAGFVPMFFFLTLYMQTVLHYSPIQTGAAYLPLTGGVIIASGIASQLFARIGTKPVIVAAAVIAAGGLYWLSRIPVDGSYVSDILPGLLVTALGAGGVFVGVTTAANAGVSEDKTGLAAGQLNTGQQLGTALGLAILSALATAHTNSLLRTGHETLAQAATHGYARALLVGASFALAGSVVALLAPNTRQTVPAVEEEPALDLAA